MKDLVSEVKEIASRELQEEAFRKAVEAEKERIRARKKYWFPWRIKIINLNKT